MMNVSYSRSTTVSPCFCLNAAFYGRLYADYCIRAFSLSSTKVFLLILIDEKMNSKSTLQKRRQKPVSRNRFVIDYHNQLESEKPIYIRWSRIAVLLRNRKLPVRELKLLRSFNLDGISNWYSWDRSLIGWRSCSRCLIG